MPPYDQESDDFWMEREEWIGDDSWNPEIRRILVRNCANWRKEIFEHYTGLEAYADAGLEEMEKYLHGT